MPYSELTHKTLSNIKKDIIETLSIKNIDSSGNASESLTVEKNKLYGVDYFYFLENGRAPGNFPPVDDIKQWVRRKLNVDTDRLNSVAYLVGRKIANEGTEIYKDKSKGLELDDIIQKNLNDLYKKLPDIAKAEALKFVQT